MTAGNLVTTPDAAPPHALPPLWRNRPYTLLQTGKTAHVIGVGVGAFAIPLLAYQVTGSVAQAGLIAAVGELGALAGTLPGGVVADRVDRRRIILIARLVGALVWVGLAASWWSGTLTGWQLALALFASSVAAVFANPAETGAIRAVVPSEQLGTAMAVVQGRHALAGLIAGPLGGFLYGVGHAIPLLASAIGHLAMAGTTSLVRESLNGDLEAARATRPMAALAEGLRFVWQVRFFRLSLGLFMLVNIALAGLITTINLELVQQGIDPLLIGVLDLVAGAVMILGALAAGRILQRVRLGFIVIAGLGLAGLGTAGMALLHSYPGYVGMLAVAVILIPVINAGIGGYTLAITPAELQGRASSVLGLTGFLAAPIAPVVGSALLAGAGVEVALWSFAGGILLVTAVLACLPGLRRVGTPDTWSRDVIAWPPA